MAEAFKPLTMLETRRHLKNATRHCDSYTRLPGLIGEWDEFALALDRRGWLAQLGDAWSLCDNIGQYVDELVDETPFGDAFEQPTVMALPELMTRRERVAFEQLPDEIEVYRGCYHDNKWGLSWSLDRAVAAKFPGLRRYCRPNETPLLVKARVAKSKVIALKLDREEAEVICWRPRHVSTSKLRWAS